MGVSQRFLLEGFMVFFCLFVLFSLLIDIRDVDFYKEQYKKLYTIILFSYPEQTVTNS